MNMLRETALARYFAALFAPANCRSQIATLNLFDVRLSAITARGEDVHPALIRLAWWRDAIARLAQQPAAGEPLLALIETEIQPSHLPLWSALAEAHMDRLEQDGGAAQQVADAREAAAAAILGTGARALRPISAVRIAEDMANRSLTKVQFAMMWHMLTGWQPTSSENVQRGGGK